jgi:hypothetical protein
MRDKYPASGVERLPVPHFSDGDNWSTRDTEHCVKLLKDSLLPPCNQFCYGQVKSAYGSGSSRRTSTRPSRRREGRHHDIQDRDGICRASRASSARGADGQPDPRTRRTARRDRDLAKSYGLDFYETIFELVDHDELNMIASYGGFPRATRTGASAWSTSTCTKSYEYGLSRSTSSSSTTTPATRT